MPCRASGVSTLPTKVWRIAYRLLVNEDEEERLVLDDGPTETHAELVSVLIILLDAIKVVEPLAGIERELRFVQNALPRNWFVPERVTICTCPEPRPNSASTGAVMMRTSSTRSGLV